MVTIKTILTISISLAALISTSTYATENKWQGEFASYQNWQKEALDSDKAIGTKFWTLKKTLNRLRNFEANQLGQSWIYQMAADTAAHQPFAEAIRQQAGNNPRDYFQSLKTDPHQLVDIDHSVEAFRGSLSRIKSDDKVLRRIAERFESWAYEKKLPPLSSSSETTAINFIPVKLYQSTNRNQLSIMERTMLLAIADILQIDNTPALRQQTQALANDDRMTACLRMAQRNVDQCQAASRNQKDLAFCTAKHGVGEVAGCFSWILP